MSTAELMLPVTADGSGSTATPLSAEARFVAAITPLMPDLVRYFARRVQPTADAADCAAETALIMWRKHRKLPADPSEQRAWAFGIARNILANHTRKRVRRSIIDDSLRDAVMAVTVAEISDEAYAAAEALTLLPEADQELMRLIIWDEFTIAEAGKVMGLRADAARKRYERARIRLRNAVAVIWEDTLN